MKDYLFKYYQKKKKAILANFDNIESLQDDEPIHELRVDIKKTRALFHFLEVIIQKKFKASRHDVFKNIFRYAGLIREIQVNLNYLDQYNLIPSDKKRYIQFVKVEEKKLRIEFNKVIEDFDFKQFSKTSKTIKKICKKTRKKKIIAQSKNFLVHESKKINQYQDAPKTNENIHKIRKHLKSFNTIASLLVDITQNEELEKLATRIKKMEILLGDWHDKVVLINSLKKFIEENKKSNKRKFSSVTKVINLINEENEKSIKSLYPKINSILYNINPALKTL